MCCRDKSNMYFAYIVIISLLVTGCATTSLKFTQSEVKLIPVISIQKVLSPRSTISDTVFARVWSAHGVAEVKGFEGQDYVIATDTLQGKEVKLAISDIVEIERIRRMKSTDTSAGQNQGSTAEAIGETLIYAPFAPLVIFKPLFGAMGLDEEKNSADREKASLAYVGMSKEDLRTYIGEPKEKYHCKGKDGSGASEVWIYRNDLVLRGGRSLFLRLDNGSVYHTSNDTSFFKDRCSLMTK